MWFIERKKNPEQRFFFVTDEEYIVGRKDVKILIENDASISRKHAQFIFTCSEKGNASKNPVLMLKDCGSKYGSSVNGNKIQANENVIVNDHDIISFGKLDSIWRVVHEPLVVTSSCVPNSDKQKIKRLLSRLGGTLVSEWTPSCNYLIMNSIMITIKTVSALASLKRIVLPSFLTYAVEQLSNNKYPSDLTMYLPPVGEPALQGTDLSFNPDSKRMNLFENKKFIFADLNQMKRLEKGISMAKGCSELINLETDSSFNSLVEPGVCVMNITSSSSQSMSAVATQDLNMNKITLFLKRHKKRFISESEIGLAVVHASVEKYCNSDFNMNAMLFGGNAKLQSQPMSEQPVIATETQQSDILKDTPMSKKRKSRLDDCKEFLEAEQKVLKLDDEITRSDDNVKLDKIRNLRSQVNEQISQPVMIHNFSDNRSSSVQDVNKRNDAEKQNENNFQIMNFKRPRDESMQLSGLGTRKKTKLKKCSESPEIEEEHVTTIKEECHSPEKPVNTIEDADIISSEHRKEETAKCERYTDQGSSADSRFMSTSKKLENTKVKVKEDLPGNLCKVENVNLLRPVEETFSRNRTEGTYQGKNFKKFKKKLNSRPCRTINRITELVAYVKKSEKIYELDEWYRSNDLVESQEDQIDDDDKFDWDAPLKSHKKKTVQRF